MTDFLFYLKEGWQHIISVNALDHQLFIVALLAIYSYTEFKKIIILVTAFTVGHTITLFLSTTGIFKINSNLVEFLIPLTIMLTAAANFFNHKIKSKSINYFLALFFGLVHGLGFANTLAFMLAKEQSLGSSLFAFNIGLELGQLLVVAIVLLINYLFLKFTNHRRTVWNYMMSGLAFCVALYILCARLKSENNEQTTSSNVTSIYLHFKPTCAGY
jgi:hypothetical protein